jgi:hypothetical protein
MCLPSRLVTAEDHWAAEEAPSQRSVRGDFSQHHCHSNFPGQIFHWEATSPWHTSQSKFPGTFHKLMCSYLARENKKRQHGVSTWKNLDKLWVENMSCFLVSSDHESWIQGQVPPTSTTDSGFVLTIFSFSCDKAWSNRVAVDPMQFWTGLAASRCQRSTQPT